MLTRRDFLNAGAAALAPQAASGVAWCKPVSRGGQTNITERDTARYDIWWWREHWKRTEIQGVIVAYYLSKSPMHHHAEFLNGREPAPAIVGEALQVRTLDDLGQHGWQLLVVIGAVDARDVLVASAIRLARRLPGVPVRVGASHKNWAVFEVKSFLDHEVVVIT